MGIISGKRICCKELLTMSTDAPTIYVYTYTRFNEKQSLREADISWRTDFTRYLSPLLFKIFRVVKKQAESKHYILLGWLVG
jgi:hypothetical protein